MVSGLCSVSGPGLGMVSGRWRSWWWDAALLAALAGWTWLVAIGATHPADLAVRSFCQAHISAVSRAAAIVLNHFGQGWLLRWVLAGGLTLVALWRTRSWRAILPAAAAYLIAGFGAGLLKIWTHRDAPSSSLPPELSVRLFNDAAIDYARSYPSGHIVNAMVWWPAILLLLGLALGFAAPPGIRRFLLIAPPIIVFCTTIFLSYHWLTDDVAAVLLGLFLARVYARISWPRLLPPPPAPLEFACTPSR
jgi:hypothetical protein